MTALDLLVWGGLALAAVLAMLWEGRRRRCRTPEIVAGGFEVIGDGYRYHYDPPGVLKSLARERSVRCPRCRAILTERGIPLHMATACGAVLRWLAPVLLAVLVLPGCASMGGPRHVVTVSLAGTAGVLETFVSTEKQLVCGQPAAPQAPRCVPVSTHLQIMSHVEKAATLGAQASRVMATLPRGTPQPAEVVTMMVQVQGLISAAWSMLPQSQDKTALGQAIGVGGVK